MFFFQASILFKQGLGLHHSYLCITRKWLVLETKPNKSLRASSQNDSKYKDHCSKIFKDFDKINYMFDVIFNETWCCHCLSCCAKNTENFQKIYFWGDWCIHHSKLEGVLHSCWTSLLKCWHEFPWKSE